MSYSIRLHSIKCVEESHELTTADEPYVLATTIDLTPAPPPPIPTPIPIPTGRPVITRLYGPWENFDQGEILDLVGERPMWGSFTEPWEPEDIVNSDFVCFVVSVLENDLGSPEGYRGLVQTAAAASLAGSFALGRRARVNQLLADVRSAMALTDLPEFDNHIGTQELRIDPVDLAIPAGTHKDKKLFFDGGDEGKWELVFRLVHHEPRLFPGGRLTALSRRRDLAEIWAVARDGHLHGNWFVGRWHGWYTLRGPQFDQNTYLASVSRGANHMEVWGVASDGIMRGIWFDDGWKEWYGLPGAVFRPGAPVAAVSRYRHFMEVWAVDVNGDLRGKFFVSGEGWKPDGTWYTISGQRFPSGAHVAAITRSPFDMQVFVVADNAPIQTVRWGPTKWGAWKQLGTESFPLTTPIAAVVRKLPNQPPPIPSLLQPIIPRPRPTVPDPIPDVQVLAIDRRQNVRDFWYEGDLERGWYQAGIESFTQGGTVAAASREPNSVDIWAARDSGRMNFTQGVTGGWQRWVDIDAPPLNQAPALPPPFHIAAVSAYDGRLEVWIVRGGVVWGNLLTDGSWQGWYPLRWSFVA